jgi:hypothetical protein
VVFAVLLQMIAFAPHASAGGPPVISVSNASVIEGHIHQINAVFTITLDKTSESEVKVDLRTNDITAIADDDYVDVTSPDFTFDPHTDSKTFVVNVKGDTSDEDNETFELELSNPENAELDDSSGRGTIRDDDPEVTHSRNISLELSRHLRAAGRVTVDDGFNRCRRSRPVRIQRRRPSGWANVANVLTNDEGRFSTSLPDRTGRYRARALWQEFVAVGDTHECAVTTSEAKRHTH